MYVRMKREVGRHTLPFPLQQPLPLRVIDTQLKSSHYASHFPNTGTWEASMSLLMCTCKYQDISLLLQSCAMPSPLISEVNTRVTVRHQQPELSPHFLPFYQHYLYSPVELSPRQWRPWHSAVSLYRLCMTHTQAWIQNGKCLDKTFIHIHKV